MDSVKEHLKPGQSLIIHGPASSTVLSGNASTLGKPLTLDEALVVRAGRSKIIEAQDDVELEIVAGEGGKIDEVEGSTIPSEWSDFVKRIAIEKGRKPRIMILGGVDTGKNTFITYACNMLLKEGLNVAVMDADIGQGEIGPPTTMAVAFVRDPISELLELSFDEVFFVGSTSPAYVVGRVLQGAEKLMNFVNENAPEATMLINMPGWVTGAGAVSFTLEMTSKLKVSNIVALQRKGEVEDILNGLPRNLEVTRLDASSYARMRSREDRKFLRETSYRKYFLDSKEIKVRYTSIDFSPLFSSRGRRASDQIVREVESLLKSRVVYCEETDFSINAITEKYIETGTEIVVEDETQEPCSQSELQTTFGSPLRKEIRLISETELSNLMLALFGKNDELLSLGTLRRIDFRRKRAIVTSMVKVNEVAKIEVGKVKVNPEGYEMGYAEILRVATPK
jgi:polynucleotide 5'-hydroxyl-kinase GRC3/NOL9